MSHVRSLSLVDDAALPIVFALTALSAVVSFRDIVVVMQPLTPSQPRTKR